MKIVLKIIASVLVMSVLCGCASSYVLKGSKQKATMRVAVARGDEAAIKAVRLGDDGVGLGIDISNWEALKERPWLQAGAAILDFGILYASKEVIDNINDDGDNNDGGRQNVSIVVSGSDDTSVSVTSTGDSTSTDNSNNSDNSDEQDNSQ